MRVCMRERHLARERQGESVCVHVRECAYGEDGQMESDDRVWRP